MWIEIQTINFVPVIFVLLLTHPLIANLKKILYNNKSKYNSNYIHNMKMKCQGINLIDSSDLIDNNKAQALKGQAYVPAPTASDKVLVPKGQAFVPETSKTNKVLVPKGQVFTPETSIVNKVLVPEGQVFVPESLTPSLNNL